MLIALYSENSSELPCLPDAAPYGAGLDVGDLLRNVLGNGLYRL